MTQEDKELQLIDLCGRLPYGVKCTTKSLWNGIYTIVGYKDNRFFLDCPIYEDGDDEWMIESIVPYLRPLSSITEEEKEEFEELFPSYSISIERVCVYHSKRGDFNLEVIDWLNKKMFAYRTIDGKNMFELGLALEAPKGIYKVY